MTAPSDPMTGNEDARLREACMNTLAGRSVDSYINPTAILALLDRVHNAENIARLAEESETGWRREADEVGARLLRVEALVDEFDSHAHTPECMDDRCRECLTAEAIRAALTAAPDDTREA